MGVAQKTNAYPKLRTRPTWAEVSLKQLQENYRIVRQHLPERVKIMSVVKADAYGHGLEEVSNVLAGAGTDWFGVTSADEGVELRASGIEQPVLLLTGFWKGELEALSECDLTPAIYTDDQLAALHEWGKETGRKMRFHLKVNTGMGRLGLHWQDVARFLSLYRTLEHVEMEGLFTHLASAEDYTSEQTGQQVERFESVLADFRRAGVDPRYVHVANSAAIAGRPNTWANMVRPGALLYGIQVPLKLPAGMKAESVSLPVKNILTWKSRIIALKEVPAGTPLGYSAGYVTEKTSRVATIPAGYADGLKRSLSNRGRTIVCDRYAPIIGNISMDLTLLDVTEIPGAAVGDEVILIGHSDHCSVTPAEISALTRTVPYDVLCAVSKRVPRIYLR